MSENTAPKDPAAAAPESAAAAAPALLPPGLCSKFHGLRDKGWKLDKPEVSMP